MSNAARDQNRVPTMVVADSTDGTTPINIKVNPTIHSLMIDDNTTGTDRSDAPAKRDENRVPLLMGVSSDDGVTPVPIYGDASTGALLVDST